MADKIVPFDVDVAAYYGNGKDGCYYQTAKGPDGWYVTVVVDCETGSFVQDLVTDDGPHPSEESAESMGHETAVDWCLENDVYPEELRD